MLILTCAVGYDVEQFLFLQSLRRLGSQAQVVAVVDAPDNGLSINLARHFQHLDLVRQTQQKYVFLTDFRDVLFQKDPEEVEPDGLWVFQEHEDAQAKKCPYNSRWMRRAYGETMLSVLGDKPICCGGTIMGDRESIEAYLEAVTKEINDLNLYNLESPTHDGIDQSVHNYLVYMKGMATKIHPNKTNPYVYTVGYVPELKIAKHQIRNEAGVIPYVVHQYDRHIAWP